MAYGITPSVDCRFARKFNGLTVSWRPVELSRGTTPFICHPVLIGLPRI